MFRKQIAEERIENSEKLARHLPLVKKVANKVDDKEYYYEWLMKADEKVIADWADDVATREAL